MRQLLLLILVLFTLFSCKQDNKEVIQSIKIEDLRLDNTKLWQANTETTNGIKKMQLLLNNFSDKESAEAYSNLEQNLKVEFTNIFSKCTMTGESHNQLHNFLKPMLKYFEGLSSGDLKVCKKNYNALNEHLKEYSNYFE